MIVQWILENISAVKIDDKKAYQMTKRIVLWDFVTKKKKKKKRNKGKPFSLIAMIILINRSYYMLNRNERSVETQFKLLLCLFFFFFFGGGERGREKNFY